jgi:hypothetical protein
VNNKVFANEFSGSTLVCPETHYTNSLTHTQQRMHGKVITHAQNDNTCINGHILVCKREIVNEKREIDFLQQFYNTFLRVWSREQEGVCV